MRAERELIAPFGSVCVCVFQRICLIGSTCQAGASHNEPGSGGH